MDLLGREETGRAEHVAAGHSEMVIPSAARNLRFCHELAATSSKLVHTGIVVFLAGLKNGILTIFAVTLCRTASIVISICSLRPSWA